MDHFYNKYIDTTDIEKTLKKINLTDEEVDYLRDVVEKTLHLEITKFILDELPVEYRDEMIMHLEHTYSDPAVETMVHRSIDNFEERVRGLIHHVKQEFIHSIQDYGEKYS